MPYTTGDLDYNNNNSRANREQNDSSARPGIAGETADLAKYDTVYLAILSGGERIRELSILSWVSMI